jgi:hypothetical protein
MGSLLNVYAIRQKLMDLLVGEPDTMTFHLEKRTLDSSLTSKCAILRPFLAISKLSEIGQARVGSKGSVILPVLIAQRTC